MPSPVGGHGSLGQGRPLEDPEDRQAGDDVAGDGKPLRVSQGNEVPGIQPSIRVIAKACLVLGTPAPRATTQPADSAPEDSALGLSWNPKTPGSKGAPGQT